MEKISRESGRFPSVPRLTSLTSDDAQQTLQTVSSLKRVKEREGGPTVALPLSA